MLSFFRRITDKWLGKSIDRDRVFWAQCVDWVKQYAVEQGYPITTSGNAIDLWRSWLWPNYTRVINSANIFPKVGDIVLFSWPTKYGHIAIADEWCTTIALKVIEQNAQTGNGDGKRWNAIRKHTYDYQNPKCVGWFTR